MIMHSEVEKKGEKVVVYFMITFLHLSGRADRKQ
jgi:hypothetical protein